MRSRLALLAFVAILPAVLWAVVPVGSLGASGGAKLSSLKNKIEKTQAELDKKKGTETVLTTDVAAWQNKINGLQGKINTLQGRQDQIEVGLNRETSELNKIQDDLRTQRRRQVKLKARLEEGRRVLGQRLFELYRADAPTLISVVLDSKGFAELLERSEFLQRIGEQDRRVITLVRAARIDATVNANRLGTLEHRQQAITSRIKVKRDAVASIKRELVTTRSGFDKSKERKAALLASVKEDRHKLEGSLSQMRETQAKIEGVLVGGGPIRQGSGSMIWPVNGPLTSPFCERRAWESCHPGIDIGVPAGTPIRAADSGTVRVASMNGGYGNYTCIAHSASLSTCYAHQSRYAVTVGQNVSKGQVIGYVGCTGLCFGDHLHFEVRINGQVTNPLNYL
ncbi:MAG: peptidoglycan DD-metalloendopeptidase family protein [Actinomycetes bacterium]